MSTKRKRDSIEVAMSDLAKKRIHTVVIQSAKPRTSESLLTNEQDHKNIPKGKEKKENVVYVYQGRDSNSNACTYSPGETFCLAHLPHSASLGTNPAWKVYKQSSEHVCDDCPLGKGEQTERKEEGKPKAEEKRQEQKEQKEQKEQQKEPEEPKVQPRPQHEDKEMPPAKSFFSLFFF
jgi:hypothetical protein